MKTTVRTIILSAAVIFAAMSCQKEESVPGTQDQVKAGETIQVNIDACLGNLVAADGTKATAEPVVRLKWEITDKVDAYCGSTKLNTNPITVTPSENGLSAKLTGEITITGLTSGTSVITFVYSNGCTTTDGLTFDFSSQTKTNGIPFVAYATLVYDETAALTEKMVEFKFATSVMKIAATDLGGGKITEVAISGINTKVTLTPSTDKASPKPDIAGSSESPAKNITTDNFSSSSDSTRAIVTVGLVPDNSTNRTISFTKYGDIKKTIAITSEEIKESTSYYTPCAFEGVDGVAYVIIGGKKWATMNLGASDINGYGKLYSWGNLTGQSGDSFNPAFTDDNYKGTSGNPTEGSKINNTDNIWNKMKHDAAYYELGGNWRMPSKGDFIALDIACGGDGKRGSEDTKEIKILEENDIESDKVKQGKYWLAANQTVLKDIESLKGITAAGMLYSDGENYLFFPAAGGSNGTDLRSAGSRGYYWSSTLYSSTNAYNLRFSSSNVYPQTNGYRYIGRSVRPVSD